MDGLKRTPEVAEEVGTSAKYVNKILSHHNELRPAKKIGANYWWTPEEIEALKKHRALPHRYSTGRKKKAAVQI